MRKLAQKRDAEAALMGVRELARYLGRGRNRLYGAIRRGEIPGVVKLGGRWYARRAALEMWLKGENGQTKHS